MPDFFMTASEESIISVLFCIQMDSYGLLCIHTVNKNVRYSGSCFDQTFLGLGLGRLFPASESFVSDIPAGDGNPLNLYLQCIQSSYKSTTLQHAACTF